MDYWTGKRNIKIPRLGFGTWKITGKQCISSINKALEIGYRHIDTAQIYENEVEVGQAIEASGIPRKELFLVTKVWRDFLDFRELLISVSRSLENLRVDFIDLLLVHWPNPSYPLEGTLSAFKELVDTKKVKWTGLSNFNTKMIQKARKIYPPLICNQVEYHPFLRQKSVLREIRKNKMFLTAYSPLARGLVFKNHTLKSIAKKYNKTPGQVALRWLMDQKDVIVIPKSKNKIHIKSNFNIFDFQLSPEDKKRINALGSQKQRLVNPSFSPKWDAS